MVLTANRNQDAVEVYSETAFLELWGQHPHLAINMLKTALLQGSISPHQAIETIGKTTLNQPQWDKSESNWADHYRLSFLMHSFLRADRTPSGEYKLPYDLDVQHAALKTMCRLATAWEMPMVAEVIYLASSNLKKNATCSYPWDSELILGAIDKVIRGASEGQYPKFIGVLDLLGQFSRHIPHDDMAAWKRYTQLITDNEKVIYSAPREGFRIDSDSLCAPSKHSIPHLRTYMAVLFDGDLTEIETNQTLTGLVKLIPVKLAITLVDMAPDIADQTDKMRVAKNLFTQCAGKFGSIYSFALAKWDHRGRDYPHPGDLCPNIFDSSNGEEPLAGVFARAVDCGFLPADVLLQLEGLRRTREHLIALDELVRDSRELAHDQEAELKVLLSGQVLSSEPLF